MSLIIGYGLIGRALYYRLRCPITTRKEIDLSRNDWDVPKCTGYICAGETSTLKCEENPEETYLINVTNTIKLARKLDFCVFLSSERVFDGSVPFRTVNDKTCPTTEYGRQKAEAEKKLLKMGAAVIRLSKVIGWDVPLFEGWIRNLTKGLPIYPFSNMSMSPLPVEFVAEYIEKIGSERKGGLYQLSSQDISYDRIAYHICNYMNKDMSLVRPVEAKIGHLNTTLKTDVDVPDAWEIIYKWCRNRIK